MTDDDRYFWKDAQRRGERDENPLDAFEGLFWGGLFGAAVWALILALVL